MRSDGRTLMLAAACVLVCCIAVSGCAGAHGRTYIEAPAAARLPSLDDQLDFFDSLQTQPIVSNADAVHALLLFGDPDHPAVGSWETELAEARELGWFGSAESIDPNTSARVGMIAGAIAGISGLDLGVVGLLTGGKAGESSTLREAAATRRARRLSLIPPRSSEQALSGPELLALLRRAEAYEAFRARRPTGIR